MRERVGVVQFSQWSNLWWLSKWYHILGQLMYSFVRLIYYTNTCVYVFVFCALSLYKLRKTLLIKYVSSKLQWFWLHKYFNGFSVFVNVTCAREVFVRMLVCMRAWLWWIFSKCTHFMLLVIFNVKYGILCSNLAVIKIHYETLLQRRRHSSSKLSNQLRASAHYCYKLSHLVLEQYHD